ALAAVDHERLPLEAVVLVSGSLGFRFLESVALVANALLSRNAADEAEDFRFAHVFLGPQRLLCPEFFTFLPELHGHPHFRRAAHAGLVPHVRGNRLQADLPFSGRARARIRLRLFFRRILARYAEEHARKAERERRHPERAKHLHGAKAYTLARAVQWLPTSI